jgi:hypothetical protein
VIPHRILLSFRSEAEESASAFVLLARSKNCICPDVFFFSSTHRKSPDGPIASGYPSVTYNYFHQKQPKNRLSSPKPT